MPKKMNRVEIYAFMQESPRIGFAVLSLDNPQAISHWVTVIGGRFMGEDRADEFGARNGVKGELLFRLTPSHLSGMADMTR